MSEATDDEEKSPVQYNGYSPTLDELAFLLPTAEQLGSDYRIDDSPDDPADAAMDAEFARACPEAEELFDNLSGGAGGADSGTEVERSFVTEDGRTISVSLEPQVDQVLTESIEEELKALVVAGNKCDTLHFEVEGLPVEMNLRFSEDPLYGDIGLDMYMELTMAWDLLPQPIVIHTMIRTFTVGNVDVTVSAGGGFDSTMDIPREAPGDYGIADSLARTIEHQATKMQQEV